MTCGSRCRPLRREAGAALAYANLIGGQDELVFDGGSCWSPRMAAPGARAPVRRGPDRQRPGPARRRRPDHRRRRAGGRRRRYGHHDPAHRAGAGGRPAPGPGPRRFPRDRSGRRCRTRRRSTRALVLGVRDYVRKNGFRSVILGLSGGIDSALTATIAADAVGPDNVHVVLDAEPVLQRSLRGRRRGTGQAAGTARRDGTDPVDGRRLRGRAQPDSPAGLPAENLQARVRGVILMGLSNAAGHLVLTTGNKSELATGYSTLYGDSAGGFGPIKDVLKTLVWELARWRNTRRRARGETPPIPENSITKPPSAELAPGQMDSDTLPDYPVLDAMLDDYVEQDMGAAELIAAGHDPALVERVIWLVDQAEYKRRQYPPGPKITQKNFGRDRRLPITNAWRERLRAPRPGCRRGPWAWSSRARPAEKSAAEKSAGKIRGGMPGHGGRPPAGVSAGPGRAAGCRRRARRTPRCAPPSRTPRRAPPSRTPRRAPPSRTCRATSRCRSA